MLDKYKQYHIKRIIEATNGLYNQRFHLPPCHDPKGDLSVSFVVRLTTSIVGRLYRSSEWVKDCSVCLSTYRKEFVESWLLKIL